MNAKGATEATPPPQATRSPMRWTAFVLAKAGTWSAVATGTLLSVWFGAEHVHVLAGAAVAWLTSTGTLPNWVLLLAGGIVVFHAVFGLLAVRRRRVAGRTPRPEWHAFRRGVFGTIAWSWNYTDAGEPIDVAVFCPADDTRMGIRDEGESRLRGFVSLVCPLCGRRCRVGVVTFDNAHSMIAAEIETGRWRDHRRAFAERLHDLKEAVGEARNWNGGTSLDDVRVDRDRQIEAKIKAQREAQEQAQKRQSQRGLGDRMKKRRP